MFGRFNKNVYLQKGGTRCFKTSTARKGLEVFKLFGKTHVNPVSPIEQSLLKAFEFESFCKQSSLHFDLLNITSVTLKIPFRFFIRLGKPPGGTLSSLRHDMGKRFRSNERSSPSKASPPNLWYLKLWSRCLLFVWEPLCSVFGLLHLLTVLVYFRIAVLCIPYSGLLSILCTKLCCHVQAQ